MILQEIYKKMIQIQERGVDAFICETVTSIEEAQILIEATSETSKKVILSFTVDEVDGTILRSGESLELALNEFDNSKVDAFLINCSPPESMIMSLEILKIHSFFLLYEVKQLALNSNLLFQYM